MSDPDPSGAVTAAAEAASTPSTPPTPTLPSTFSNNRGSGLARGKRPASPPAPTASASPTAEYKPTAVSVITAPTEYKNPFAPPAPAPTESPAPVPAPAATAAEVAHAPAAPAAEVHPAEQPARHDDAGPAGSAAAPETKPAELKILPPEAPKHIEHSWESDSFRTVAAQAAAAPVRPADVPPAEPRRDGRRGDRPYFRPERERRNDRPGEGRPAWSDSRREAHDQGGRPEASPAPAPQAEPPKSGGLFGWVKKLFGSAPAEPPKPETAPGGDRGFSHDGHRHRRRRRGGHGRHFQGDQQGPREGQPSGENRGYGGENRGYGGERRHHGRRRHRGGGDYRGGRPEGGPPAGS